MFFGLKKDIRRIFEPKATFFIFVAVRNDISSRGTINRSNQ